MRPMDGTFGAALAVTRESIAMFRDALRGLPDEAMAWTPAAGMNPLSVLAAHSCSSLRFFMGCAAGQVSSLQAYREGPRAASFAETGWNTERALEELDRLEGDVKTLLAEAPAAALDSIIGWPEDPSLVMTGAGALFRSVAHLREHAGHAQVMRDLWLASHPG
ncbi:MAG: DinB family protein [Chloroflexi bacterium CFX7]|nr:DinB family protein [Chloroflexi bacterium CFX7]RIL01632.1 MAG: hypothetical protein DCC78_10350 [bacterium]